MSDGVGFFCKSFRPDFNHLRVMLESFFRHNPENIPLTLSLPADDIAAFHNEFGQHPDNIRVVSDESYSGHDLSRFRGWHGQQICKLTSWRIVPEDYYLVLDSDCYFIRDVKSEEFRPHGRKYIAFGSFMRTVLKEKNETLLRYLDGTLELTPDLFPPPPSSGGIPLSEFIHYKDLDCDNPNAIARSGIPPKVFGSKKWIFFQPGQVFSRGILIALEEFFRAHGLSAGDAILISPWEYNWYGEFAANHCFDDTQFNISSILHFQSEEDIKFAHQIGLTEAKMATKFGLIQMAARHLSAFTFGVGQPG